MNIVTQNTNNLTFFGPLFLRIMTPSINFTQISFSTLILIVNYSVFKSDFRTLSLESTSGYNTLKSTTCPSFS